MGHTLVTRLEERLRARSAHIAVIGLGYVGLPLALAFQRAGLRVVGIDVDQERVDTINAGRSYIRHIARQAVAQAVSAGQLTATTAFDALSDVDAIIICVPTPLTKQREPDMQYVRRSADEIARRLRKGQLVVLESTTYPGTTDELLRQALDTSGLRLGDDYLLAFSPEREDPGNPRFETRSIPKLVGGVDQASGDAAELLYGSAVANVVRVASARVAEAAKLTENIFRGVNIALVNELKMAFDRMGIDVWEVLDAAETKPFGFMRFNPGPGWGGHCIPVDPFYMSWKAREHDVSTKFIELSGEVNARMPEYVVGKLQSALNDRGKPVRGARILLLGVAYKANIDDCRESPAYRVLELLGRLGASVSYHDPFVDELPDGHAYKALSAPRTVPLSRELVASVDAVLLLTAHDGLDYAWIAEHAPLVLDTRGRFPCSPRVVRA
jgi:UDP-N-acetyl-D-glucosamine dehydrogenase